MTVIKLPDNCKFGDTNLFVTVKGLNPALAISAMLAWVAILPTPSSGSGAPVIVTQPQNQMAFAGSNATFSVSATGSGLYYQWYENGTTPIAGATAPSLTLMNLEGSQAYDLSVTITNAEGSTNSSNAQLTVLTVLTGPVNPYAPGTLGYDLFQGTRSLAGSTTPRPSHRGLHSSREDALYLFEPASS